LQAFVFFGLCFNFVRDPPRPAVRTPPVVFLDAVAGVFGFLGIGCFTGGLRGDSGSIISAPAGFFFLNDHPCDFAQA
jgi:hypothetical protein